MIPAEKLIVVDLEKQKCKKIPKTTTKHITDIVNSQVYLKGGDSIFSSR